MNELEAGIPVPSPRERPSVQTALYVQKSHIFLDMRHIMNYVHPRKVKKLNVVHFPAPRSSIHYIDRLSVRSVV